MTIHYPRYLTGVHWTGCVSEVRPNWLYPLFNLSKGDPDG